MNALAWTLHAVAVDLDGTLVDSAPDLAIAANHALEAIGAPPLPSRRIRSLIGHGFEALLERALGESLGASATPEQSHAAREAFITIYRERGFVESRLYDGVAETLVELRRRRLALACVTNKHSMFTLPLLKASKLHPFFDLVLCADDPVLRKPAPGLLLELCRRLSLRPDAVLMIGDAAVDIEAARAAGCRSALVRHGYGRDAEDAGPDVVIERFAQLPGLVGNGAPKTRAMGA